MPERVEARTIERETMRRVYWRLVPMLFCAMFFNYLDRINIGFAGLRMNHDIGLTAAQFGFGASVFFAGYMVLEVPSNLMLHRIGARVWIARILLSWGLIASLMAFVWNAGSFYTLRFLLGVAEAGFLPGLAVYVTYWFPSEYRARAVGGYIIAGQVAAVLGGPVSTALMTYCDGLGGLQGWQWMFILEGVPTMILGLVFLAALTDRPARARWLAPEQHEWLDGRLARERTRLETEHSHKWWAGASDGRAWALAILFGCALIGVYGLLIWLPLIIKSFGTLTDIEVGLLSAVPPLLGVIGTLIVSWSSDRFGDRKRHLAGVYILAGAAIGMSAVAPSAALSYVMLCLTGLGINSGNSLFWSINASLMTGVAAAASIAFVNTVAQFGGLFGPWMIGWVRDTTGSYAAALLTISAFLFLAATIALALRVDPRRTAALPAQGD
ncbi:MAG: MFS transporter [Acetobacteraceae bacterium]|nr:MFS transporter [Acetobacteraceae bacterium]